MDFSSLTFILLFLPVLVFVYSLNKSIKYKNLILLIATLLFYYWSEPKQFFLILVISAIIYGFTWWQSCVDEKKHKWIFLLSLAILVGTLLYFKYIKFAIQTTNRIFESNIGFPEVIPPLGISFYIFQSIGYIVDVYNGKIKAEKNIINMMLFLMFFPTISSGPIMRFEQFSENLKNRLFNFDQIAVGLRRFILGLSKKVAVGNQVALVADLMFNQDPSNLNFAMAWLGIIAYSLQIYFDFSGYTDMAIGIGQILGFQLPENFNYPYTAKSNTDFWHRWHMTLSIWFRDYIYIPLGGNRCSIWRWLLNLLIVWGVTGFWHGADTTFFLWGLYYAILLIFEKKFLQRVLDQSPAFMQHIYVIGSFLTGWILFRSNSLHQIYNYLLAMVRIPSYSIMQGLRMMDILYLLPLFGIAIVGCTPLFKKILMKIEKSRFAWLNDGIYVFLLIVSIVLCVTSSYKSFIYFNF